MSTKTQPPVTPAKRSKPKFPGQIRHESVTKALNSITDTLSEIHLSTVQQAKASRGHR